MKGSRPSLPLATRLGYGLGLGAEGVKNNGFNFFLLFFYQQIVGLDPVLCGVALFIALCVDAITDPAVGAWSDGIRSRWGRRHPFMFASSIPLALCYFAVFVPPIGASEWILFLWLVVFACGTRFAMTLFVIPHSSLVAELTEDYDERTRLQSLRTVFGWIFGLVNAVLAFGFFLRPTEEYPVGLQNPAGYYPFALFGALVILLVTAVSSAVTLNRAIAVQPDTARIPWTDLGQLPRAIRGALANRNYRAVLGMGLCGAMSFGMSENLGNYVNTFFWGFSTEQLSVFVLVIMTAAVCVLAAARPLAARFGKRNVAMVATMLPAIASPSMVWLKIAGVLPSSGTPALLGVLCCSAFVGYLGIILMMIMLGSMIADVTDEHELATKTRQEGVMFSAGALIGKASSGLGVLLAGLLITLSNFPEDATVETLDPAIPTRLAIFVSSSILLFGIVSALSIRSYRLGRDEHALIREKLQAMRSGDSSR